MRTPPASVLNWATLFCAAALAPFVVRIALLHDSALSPGIEDGLGFIADAATCLLFAAGLAATSRLPRFGRWIGAVLTALWSLAHFANFEHIRELGSIIDLTYAGYLADEAFLRGSALAPTHPVLLLVTTAGTTALAAWALSQDRRYRVWPVALAGAGAILMAALLPQSQEAATWRQNDLFVRQALRLISHPISTEFTDQPRPGGLSPRDLTGVSITSAPRARNVLLVILEGVSGAYLPSLREPHGISSPITMPRLDQIAKGGLSYAAFIATQRQTNRGEYAILCGDYPRLITAEAKMTALVGKGPIDCLPAALRDAGYSTNYLQAAPLPFMMKDQFMPQTGFERVLGDDWFDEAYNRNHWGVDDRTFFESSLELIAELDSAPAPWFLTLLTVGTHHRYNVPEDFAGESDKGSPEWAFEYLDLAVAEFITRLEETGVLDDTLVLLTSDESQATEAGAADARNMLMQGWGFLVALLPSPETAAVDQVFTQPDLPISILDYLQMDSLRPDWTGRSVFRRYDRGRDVYWGNTYLGMVAGLSPDLDLTVCTEDFATCGVSRMRPGALFSAGNAMRQATPEEHNRLREIARQSLATYSERPDQRNLTLISKGKQPVIRTSGQQYVFGGQFLTLPPHSETDVEIVVTLDGRSGWIEFAHNFLVARQPHHVWSERLEVGDTLKLRYTVGAETVLDEAECRLWVTDFEGEDLALDFEKASLDVTVLPASSPPASSRVHTYEIARAGEN